MVVIDKVCSADGYVGGHARAAHMSLVRLLARVQAIPNHPSLLQVPESLQVVGIFIELLPTRRRWRQTIIGDLPGIG